MKEVMKEGRTKPCIQPQWVVTHHPLVLAFGVHIQ